MPEFGGVALFTAITIPFMPRLVGAERTRARRTR